MIGLIVIVSILGVAYIVAATAGILVLDNEVKKLEKRIETLEAKCP